MKTNKIIAVDFDQTISMSQYPLADDPNWKIINALKMEKTRGARLILWTCRAGKPLEDAIRACTDWGLEFDAVNENLPEILCAWKDGDTRKIYADEYWDDRAYNPIRKGNLWRG